MRQRNVPVTMGSPRFRSGGTPACNITDAWFPPHAALEPHTHERTIFAVMLEGSFESVIAGRKLDCTAASVWTEPREEEHANYVGAGGARVLVVQPDPANDGFFAPFASLTDEVSFVRHAGVAADARRVLVELRMHDTLSSLAIDALVLCMMSAASRAHRTNGHGERFPLWLKRAQEHLHAHFREGLRLADVAAAADVHPHHLAHGFRRYLNTTVGGYARWIRLEWAAERLASSDEPISAVAVSAGYSDQSHLTRECRRALGTTPGEYRRLHRPARR